MPPSWVTYHPALNRWVQRERTQTAAPKRDSSSGRRRRPDELSIKSAFGQNGVQANFLCCTTSPLREVKMRTSQEMFAQPRIAANRRDGWEILSRDCLSMALPRGVYSGHGLPVFSAVGLLVVVSASPCGPAHTVMMLFPPSTFCCCSILKKIRSPWIAFGAPPWSSV